MIISGSSHPSLAKQIAHLTKNKLANVLISKFPNGEKKLHLKNDLKNKTVAIVQPFSTPVDEHIIEFCLLVDAVHHLGAKKIIGIVPWFGYSPQDKLFRKGEPNSAHVVSKLIEAVNLDHIIIIDIHSEKSLKNFSIPITHLTSLPLFIDHFKNKPLNNHVAVALDKGAVEKTTQFAQKLNIPLAKFNKQRDRASGKITFTSFEGNVEGKHVISFDDFVSTGSTRINASKILKEKGALSYTDCITHALLAQDSPQKLQQSNIDKIITTDTYPIPGSKRFPKLKILPIAPLIAKSLDKLI